MNLQKTPDVIYKMPQKNGPKNALFLPVFFSFFAPKPLHIVVVPLYFLSRPQYVIIIITSTCVEWSKKMPFEAGGALAEGYVY
ncbi:hypothetical protein [Sinanaerobacter chloroacetimidivorans]|uniref:hypothetical protein n=1 Tax=Sinanaerobacter chloroacetimidivorans TaxID=2818044 RepID=UPI001D0466C6|nr:hypothetical protein [Sinanaerobacter chloroacetimidivorans]